jgi:hypothetical protein
MLVIILVEGLSKREQLVLMNGTQGHRVLVGGHDLIVLLDYNWGNDLLLQVQALHYELMLPSQRTTAALGTGKGALDIAIALLVCGSNQRTFTVCRTTLHVYGSKASTVISAGGRCNLIVDVLLGRDSERLTALEIFVEPPATRPV